ncbi:reverse partial [Lasallia pustulata]|uniref:RNA-directed DNA polymerase n=1 Tax=Lasallia pustulata TaxID=136370 RepID=A0A1W5CRT8_9LECA|nr:reverse partial [Lasallia pustulata]
MPLTEFSSKLAKCFKMTMTKALEQLNKEHYSLSDAQANREPQGYLQNMMRYAQAAGVTDLLAQLTWAWQGLDIELQTVTVMPRSRTTLQEFSEELERTQNDKSRMIEPRIGSIAPQTAVEMEIETGIEIGTIDQLTDHQNKVGLTFITEEDKDIKDIKAFKAFLVTLPMVLGLRRTTDPFINLPQNQGASSGPQPVTQVQSGPRPGQLQITAGMTGASPNRSYNRSNSQGFRSSRNNYQGQRGNGSWGNYGNPQAAYHGSFKEAYPGEGWDSGYHNQEAHNYHGSQMDHFDGTYPGNSGPLQDVQNENHSLNPSQSKMDVIEGQENRPPGPNMDANYTDAYYIEIPPKPLAYTCRKRVRITNQTQSSDQENQAKVGISEPAGSLVNGPETTAAEVGAHLVFSESSSSKVVCPVVESDAPTIAGNGMAFNKWHYATATASFTMEGTAIPICVDSGCTMSLIDRAFLKETLPKTKILQVDRPIGIRGIGSTRYSSDEYVILDVFLDGTINNAPARAHMRREAHVVDSLKAKFLMGVDILVPERICLNLSEGKMVVQSCKDLVAPIQITAKDNVRVRRIVRTEKRLVIPPGSVYKVPVEVQGQMPLPDRDFLFEPDLEGAYAHIVDSTVPFICVKNSSWKEKILPRHTRVGTVTEYEEEECYPVDVEDHSLAAKYTPVEVDVSKPETKLANGVTIYGDAETVAVLADVINAFPRTWSDSGDMVNITPEEHLSIPLTVDWNTSTAAKLSHRAYPMGPNERAVIDEEFDKMHKQGRMSWSVKPTPFSFPVFVVWKTVFSGSEKKPTKKGRVVVDIRGLNKITTTDAYPIPLQSEIISAVHGSKFISTMDCTGFFHQWPVKEEDRHKLTVVSHRGSERFNVAVMGFKNSPPYVQQKMDNLLRPFKSFAKGYIDNIVVFSRNLAEHATHLRVLLELFQNARISLKGTKSFIGYPSATLLGQRVDGFGYSTAEEKIAALRNLKFPATLDALEIYLGMTGWLRQFVAYYAQIVEPLQHRKTELLRLCPSKGGQGQKMYTRKTTLTPTETEKEAFKFLQKSFDKPTFLTFFDRQRQLYIDIDGSKQWGFGIMVYHIKGDPGGNDFPRKSIQPVMFLSKLLNDAERNYWPTELEVAALVWTLRKTRHLVESCTKPAIVFTDHSATTSIAKQTTLSSSSMDKVNLRLVRASQYISTFNLDIRFRPGKQHIVPDALSRLMNKAAEERVGTSSDEGTLDEVFAFYVSLVELTESYRAKLVKAYNEDKQWSKIIGALRKHAESQKKEKEPEPPKNIQFRLIEGLVYYQELNGRRRLCIPKSLEKKVFELAHDDNHHCGFHRAYDVVTSNLYLRKLSKRLKSATQPMDFILGLPETEEGFDVALSVTDKCSKRVTLLPGKNTYKAEDWATVLLEGLTDWGIPDAIIIDRDPKFMSEFWKELAIKLKIEMLTSTAYHPQTDGQSEQTNQTAEIALRYFLTSSPKPNWAKHLPRLRSELNKQQNASTGKSPDEVVYGFKLRDTLSIIGGETESADSDFVKERLIIRKEAEDAANFANLLAKLQYDKHHRPLSMEVGDEVFIKLYKGYNLPSVINRKLSNQRAGPLKIVKKIGLLAYRLDIPVNWKIHPVISVAQLEPAPKGSDPYEREDRPSDPPAVEEFNSEWHDYKVEKLVGRRDRKLGKGKKITEYLVR